MLLLVSLIGLFTFSQHQSLTSCQIDETYSFDGDANGLGPRGALWSLTEGRLLLVKFGLGSPTFLFDDAVVCR